MLFFRLDEERKEIQLVEFLFSGSPYMPENLEEFDNEILNVKVRFHVKGGRFLGAEFLNPDEV